MPHRETLQQSVINKWEGCNQRVQPSLVPDGFCSFAKGVQFGLGSNAERLSGKTVTDRIPAPVYNLTPWGNFAIVQIDNAVLMYDAVGYSIDSPAFKLYAFYKLQTDLADYSGNSRTLTNNGGVTLTGTDASFAGAGLLTATNFLTVPSDISVGFWVNMGSSPGTVPYLLTKGDGSSGSGFNVYISDGTTTYQPTLYAFPFSVNRSTVLTNVNGSTWRFIKMRYFKDTGRLELGVDAGAMVVTASGPLISDWTKNFTIGGYSNPYTGLIKDVAVYDFLVSDSIFTQLYNGGTPWEP